MSLSAYGYIYNFTPQKVGFNADIKFSSHGELVGMSHEFDSTDVIVAQKGVYAIDYTVTTVSGLGSDISEATAYAIAVNGIPPAVKTTFGNSARSGDQFVNQTTVGNVILNLPAGASISLRNVGTSSDTLLDTADFTSIVNASLRFMKLN
ncbi:hypothetical protein ABEV81_10440 [Bacillus paranthracis]|uniref:hypothetical protein n=1 Tax=Bacillus paranthracis TaxID=2026186 RepID=UPI0032F357D9|nr:hypothetical protein [Bacillus paranthracis]